MVRLSEQVSKGCLRWTLVSRPEPRRSYCKTGGSGGSGMSSGRIMSYDGTGYDDQGDPGTGRGTQDATSGGDDYDELWQSPPPEPRGMRRPRYNRHPDTLLEHDINQCSVFPSRWEKRLDMVAPLLKWKHSLLVSINSCPGLFF